jgi:hypothetical protein
MRSFLRAKNNDAAELAHFAAPKLQGEFSRFTSGRLSPFGNRHHFSPIKS